MGTAQYFPYTTNACLSRFYKLMHFKSNESSMLQRERYEYKLFILRKERREEEMRDEREGSHKIKIKLII